MKMSCFMIAAMVFTATMTSCRQSIPPTGQITPPTAVTGSVKLEGVAPLMKIINRGVVGNVAALPPLKEETVVVGPMNELANVVVSINAEPGIRLPENSPKNPAVLTIIGCRFEPRIVAMQVGQELHSKNTDHLLHNVHSLAEINDSFNVAQASIGEVKVKSPKEPECIKVKSDVYPWMTAWIVVLDNPFFAVTDKNGCFTLPKGLPDGDYTLHVWHEKLGEQDLKITVKDDKSEPIAIKIKSETK